MALYIIHVRKADFFRIGDYCIISKHIHNYSCSTNFNADLRQWDLWRTKGKRENYDLKILRKTNFHALKPGAAKTFQPHHFDSERFQEFTKPLL